MKKRTRAGPSPLCIRCGISTTPITIEEKGFKLRAWKCKKCGLLITHPEDSRLLLMREQGIRASIGKLGRQTILRIPASIREIYKLDKKRFVLLKPVNEKEIRIEVS